MLKQKKFHFAARSGLKKISQEHYLRTDIPCGLPTCPHTIPASTLAQQQQIIIPDTNILLSQIDVVLHEDVKNIVILQTVLQECKNQDIAIWKRDAQKSKEKQIFKFSNEHHKDTYIERTASETPNDKNDRAIRVAANWYKQHTQAETQNEIKIILWTDDRANAEKARDEHNLDAMNTIEYVTNLAPQLMDIVAAKGAFDQTKPDYHYPEHLSKKELQDTKYMSGVLEINSYNCYEGTIRDNNGSEIIISGRTNLNRATHGDKVAIELLPKDQWVASSAGVIAGTTNPEDDDEPAAVEPADGLVDQKSAKPSGKVVGIIRRAWREYVGTLKPSAGGATMLFYPLERKIPNIRIRTRQQGLENSRVLVRIDTWPATSRYPQGHLVRRLGDVGDKATERESLLLEHGVRYQEFTVDVINCLPRPDWTADGEGIGSRADFRNLNVCSIDPPGCTDIDDALHCRQLDDEIFEVGVHIADVTHFLSPSTPMDDEAAERGTTVYLVDNRIDMLPSLLGTNLCSLREHVDRFAFSVIWHITHDGEIRKTSFTKSVIRSKCSFTYADAQLRIDDKDANDDLTISMRNLDKIAKTLRAKRIEAGALTLASSEVRFKLENDSQDPVDVEMKALQDTNALVEEFMLLANISVAKQIYKVYSDIALLRRHPTPPADRFEGLLNNIRPYGLSLDTSTSRHLADSLDKAIVPGNEYFNTLVRIMTTRCMMQAVYFIAGTMPEEAFWHYGLATSYYTHFTSPIRRYADVLVHRLLAASIEENPSSRGLIYDRTKAEAVANNLNYRHTQAQMAARSSVELYTLIYFKGKIVSETGYVTRILKNGFSVLLPTYGIEGFVITNDAFIREESEDVVQIRSIEFDGVLRVFSEVQVELTVVDPDVSRGRLQCILKGITKVAKRNSADESDVTSKRSKY